MKRLFYCLAATVFVTVPAALSAQNPGIAADTVSTVRDNDSGDLYSGFTRKLTDDRAVVPYGLTVSFHKTVHLIFSAAVRYMDIGSENLMASRVEGAANIVRIRAAVPGFRQETNFTVITQEGKYFTFNVKYAHEPQKLTIRVEEEQPAGECTPAAQPVCSPSVTSSVCVARLPELGNSSPQVVDGLMHTILLRNEQRLKRLSVLHLGIRLSVRGIHTDGRLLYLHVEIQNCTNRVFDIGGFGFRIADRKSFRHNAMQETSFKAVREYRIPGSIAPRKTVSTVIVLPGLTLHSGKLLYMQMNDKDGIRKVTLAIRRRDLDKAVSTDKITGRR